MKRIFLLVFLLGFCFRGQEAIAQVEVERLQVNITSSRPVADAILEIERRHGIVISYEDPPLVYMGDLQDVTTEVRKDLTEFAARGEQPPPVLVPKGGNLSMAYDIERAAGVPINVEGMLGELLQANTDAGNAGSFRVLSVPDMVHVLPVASRNVAGTVTAVEPVLDAIISLSLENVNGFEAFRAFCEAVSQATGQTVHPGTIPTNLFLNTSISLNEAQVVAREVLLYILEQLPTTARLSWKLFYGPEGGGAPPDVGLYALNIHPVR
jgi:hypothetical protein